MKNNLWQPNTLTDRRNKKFVFALNNDGKIGLNIPKCFKYERKRVAER